MDRFLGAVDAKPPDLPALHRVTQEDGLNDPRMGLYPRKYLLMDLTNKPI
jgi:hypothetical protein